jgi:hypothetical protein
MDKQIASMETALREAGIDYKEQEMPGLDECVIKE